MTVANRHGLLQQHLSKTAVFHRKAAVSGDTEHQPDFLFTGIRLNSYFDGAAMTS
jgi:hypothetical protein